MRVTNWGMFLLGIYLIIVGLSSFGLFNFPLSGIAQLAPPARAGRRGTDPDGQLAPLGTCPRNQPI